MSRRLENIKGNTYARLHVLEYWGRSKEGYACWQCWCRCGNICVIRGTSLKNGNTTSCGCHRKQATSAALKKRWHDSDWADALIDKQNAARLRKSKAVSAGGE